MWASWVLALPIIATVAHTALTGLLLLQGWQQHTGGWQDKGPESHRPRGRRAVHRGAPPRLSGLRLFHPGWSWVQQHASLCAAHCWWRSRWPGWQAQGGSQWVKSLGGGGEGGVEGGLSCCGCQGLGVSHVVWCCGWLIYGWVCHGYLGYGCLCCVFVFCYGCVCRGCLG